MPAIQRRSFMLFFHAADFMPALLSPLMLPRHSASLFRCPATIFFILRCRRGCHDMPVAFAGFYFDDVALRFAAFTLPLFIDPRHLS